MLNLIVMMIVRVRTSRNKKKRNKKKSPLHQRLRRSHQHRRPKRLFR